MPRRNLGTITVDNSLDKVILISSDNILAIARNSFEAFTFTYQVSQEPNSDIVGLEESVYDDNPLESSMIGTTIIEDMKSNWDQFYLVVRYIDEDGVHNSKTKIIN